MALEGGQIIRDRVAKYAIDCALTPGNAMTAFTARQMRGLEHARKTWAQHGHTTLELVDRPGLARIVQTDRYVGGLLDPLGGHVHPLNLVLGQAAALEGLGGRIHEHSRVTNIDTGPHPVVTTEHGRVRARHVLVCGNAYLGRLLHREVGSKIMPVSSQVIATEPLEPDCLASLLPANYCVEDANYFLDYFRRTPDNRLLYGGGTVYGGADPASIEAKLRPLMRKTFPGLADARIDYAWSGNFALTLPRIRMSAESRPPCCSATATAATASPPPTCSAGCWARLWPARRRASMRSRTCLICRFPGGRSLRVPLTVLGSWYYRALDRVA